MNPSKSTPRRAKGKLGHTVLDLEEVQALFAAFNRRYPTPVWNAALCAAMYGAGLRISEALALRPSDVRRKDGQIQSLFVRDGRCNRPQRSLRAALRERFGACHRCQLQSNA